METRIPATELARGLGDILGRVRYRGESFLIERSGDPVARLVPVPGKATATLREALGSWRAAGKPDPGFAKDLERIGKADRTVGRRHSDG
jgi:antitoxin (DNA-binding transcriptional repressor) of toxin-antitoxin stability system